MESPAFQLEIPGFVVLILLMEKNLKIREKRPTTQRYFLKFPSTVFQIVLNRNSNMRPSVVMMTNYCLVSGRIFRAFFGYCSLQTD